jgi:cell division protein FtsX
VPELIVLAGTVVAMAILVGVCFWAWLEVRSKETKVGPPSEVKARRG